MAALTGFVQTAHELYVARFVLGLAEAGYVPGILLCLSYWFRQQERVQAIALFMTGVPVASIMGAPISGIILDHVHWLGLSSWRWLLILEGFPAVIAGVIVYFLLPSRPSHAKFLTDEEKKWITEGLECLAGGAKSASELAQETGAHERSLRRLLRALVTLGICKQVGKDQFELTAMGGHLAGGASQSLKHWALNEVELMPRFWGSLFDTVRAGKNLTTAAEFFGTMTPELAKIFDQAMVEITGIVIPAVLAAYDFSGITRLIDVGGGYGQLLSAILNGYPLMRGVVFDLPRCAEAAKAQLAEARVSHRSEFIGGVFLKPFQRVPML